MIRPSIPSSTLWPSGVFQVIVYQLFLLAISFLAWTIAVDDA